MKSGQRILRDRTRDPRLSCPNTDHCTTTSPGFYSPKGELPKQFIHSHAHISHLAPRPREEKRSTPHLKTAHQVKSRKWGRGGRYYPQQRPTIHPCHFLFTSCPLPPYTWYDSRVVPDVKEPLQVSSRLHHYSWNNHCSLFTSITYNQPSLLHKHSSFIQCFFHALFRPSCS